MAHSRDEQIFGNDKEEIAYLRKRLDDYQNDLEEFQESSRELEAELEAQLGLSEKRIDDLSNINKRLQSENENLKTKLAKLSIESQNQILELQKELGETNAVNDRLSRCIRELEQSNDDLERAKRALDASLGDFEGRLNQQIERNVLLENEIGEKEELQVVVQRLKDEARDLRQELMIQQNTQKSGDRRTSLIPHKLPLESSNVINNNINKVRSNSVVTQTNSETQTNGTPMKQTRLNFSRSTSNPTSPSNANQQPPLPLLSPSTRISALNIVSDLLRKVGALESKLASCRNLVPLNSNRNSLSSKASAPTTPINSPTSVKDINANNN